VDKSKSYPQVALHHCMCIQETIHSLHPALSTELSTYSTSIQFHTQPSINRFQKHEKFYGLTLVLLYKRTYL